MNNYFCNLAANLSNKENNESNLLTLLKNLSDENYKQSHDFSHNFFFKSFLLGLRKFSFWQGDCTPEYHSMEFRHFPDIS